MNNIEVNDNIINDDSVDMSIREELVGIHAIQPFLPHISAPRSIMVSSQLSQVVTLTNGDERIIQTGLENQFGNYTYSKKFDTDVRIIALVDRYNGIDANSVNETVEITVIFENLETGEIDYLDVPNYHSLHQYFGFEYQWNTELLNTLNNGSVVKKDTVLADSPTRKEGGYAFGLNANICLLTIPETAEDGVVISESTAKRLSYKVYEKRTVEYGIDSFPLNMYGDEENYKAFPEIGERINDDGVLMVLREYDSELSPALTSINDVKDFNPMFDKAIYVKGKGGRIVDISLTTNPRFKKETYNNTNDLADKYANSLIEYHKKLLDVYRKLESDHYKKFRNNNMPISDKLNKLILNSLAIVNPDNKPIEKTYKNERQDLYRIEFVIEYDYAEKGGVALGAKITDLSGSKGVVVEIRKDEDMPYDPVNNIRADIIMDPSSIPSRMNVSRLYEQYFNAFSRRTKALVTNMVDGYTDVNLSNQEKVDILTEEQTLEAFKLVVGLLEHLDTEQYYAYKSALDSVNIYAIKDVLLEILDKELFLYYKVSSKKKAPDIVESIKGTIYEPNIGKINFIKDGQIQEGKTDVLIAPLYIVLLFKTADEFLSTASARTNHYNFPISAGKSSKYNLPWSNSPVKISSETESRLYTLYAGREAMAELKDRATSLETHKEVYKNILTADTPTNIDVLVDRNKIPYGNTADAHLISSVFNCAGIDLDYIPDSDK